MDGNWKYWIEFVDDKSVVMCSTRDLYIPFYRGIKPKFIKVLNRGFDGSLGNKVVREGKLNP